MDNYPEISFEHYNEELFSERKKALAVKSLFAAKVAPFCGIFMENKKLIKGFYTEAKECTEANIEKYVKEHYDKSQDSTNGAKDEQETKI